MTDRTVIDNPTSGALAREGYRRFTIVLDGGSARQGGRDLPDRSVAIVDITQIEAFWADPEGRVVLRTCSGKELVVEHPFENFISALEIEMAHLQEGRP